MRFEISLGRALWATAWSTDRRWSRYWEARSFGLAAAGPAPPSRRAAAASLECSERRAASGYDLSVPLSPRRLDTASRSRIRGRILAVPAPISETHRWLGGRRRTPTALVRAPCTGFASVLRSLRTSIGDVHGRRFGRWKMHSCAARSLSGRPSPPGQTVPALRH